MKVSGGTVRGGWAKRGRLETSRDCHFSMSYQTPILLSLAAAIAAVNVFWKLLLLLVCRMATVFSPLRVATFFRPGNCKKGAFISWGFIPYLSNGTWSFQVRPAYLPVKTECCEMPVKGPAD